MTLGNLNGNNAIGQYAQNYEDQLLQEEQKNGAVVGDGSAAAANGTGVAATGKGGQDEKIGDKSANKKGGAGGTSGAADDIKNANSKKEINETEQKKETGKADAAKETQKASNIKDEFNTDAVTKTGVTQQTQKTETIPPTIMETVDFSLEDAYNAYDTGLAMSKAVGELLTSCNGDLSKLSGEDLLIAFMKIQLEDPAKKTDTLNDLNDCMKSMRKLSHKSEMASINKQEVEQEKAIKEAEKAQKYSSAVKIFKVVAIVVIVVASIVAIAATYGGASVALPWIYAICGSVIALAGAGTATSSMVEANKNYAAQMQAAKASEAQIEAMDFERVKEIFQEAIGDNQELIQAIMESFNTFCGLLKTLIDRQAASVKVLSDATIR